VVGVDVGVRAEGWKGQSWKIDIQHAAADACTNVIKVTADIVVVVVVVIQLSLL